MPELRRCRSLLPAYLLLLGISCEPIAAQQAPPVEKTADESIGLSVFDDADVHVQLQSGELIRAAKVVSYRQGKISGTVITLTVTDPTTGKTQAFGARAIRQFKRTDGTSHFVFDDVSKLLVAKDSAQLERIRQAAQAEEEARLARDQSREEARTQAEQANQTETQRKQEEAARQAVELEAARQKREADRLAHFHKTGVWRWPELTAKSQQAALSEQKTFLNKVVAAFAPTPMQLYETKYFLFLSDMPQPKVAQFTPYLDAMYQQLCTAFGIAPGTHIWRGKAVVVVFSRELSFHQFEQAFFQVSSIGAQGLAHQRSDGNVVIACYHGESSFGLARTLVHETAHGFIHRHKSRQQLPSWLSEGIADWISAAVITADKEVQNRQKQAIQTLRESRSLGGNFFTAEHIQATQYGCASSVVDFLLRVAPAKFPPFLTAIKEGQPWPQALQSNYGWTPQQLALLYGNSVGVPGLRP